MAENFSEDDNISSVQDTPQNPFLEAQKRLAAYQAANPNPDPDIAQTQQPPYMPPTGQQGFPQQAQYPPQQPQHYPTTYFATPPPKKRGKLIYGLIASGLVLALFIGGGIVITNLISAKNSTSAGGSKVIALSTNSDLTTPPNWAVDSFYSSGGWSVYTNPKSAPDDKSYANENYGCLLILRRGSSNFAASSDSEEVNSASVQNKLKDNVNTTQPGVVVKADVLKPSLISAPGKTKFEFNTVKYTYTATDSGVNYVSVAAVRDLKNTSTSYIFLVTCTADKYTDAKLDEMISHTSLSE